MISSGGPLFTPEARAAFLSQPTGGKKLGPLGSTFRAPLVNRGYGFWIVGWRPPLVNFGVCILTTDKPGPLRQLWNHLRRIPTDD